MKKFLLATLLSFIGCVHAQSVPALVEVPTGQVIAQNGTLSYKSHDGQMVAIALKEKAALLSFEKVIVEPSKTVLVVQQSSGTTSRCPAKFFIYEIDASGTAKQSPSFGSCSHSIEVKPANGMISMSMPKMDGSGMTYYRWYKGLLSENGSLIY